jgi:DNA invertase Pin-like site-specific DNA recombinase
VRVSKDETYHTGAGVDAQRASIVGACRERGWEVMEIVEDVGFSGRDLRRPGMQAALTRLESGDASCLVVAKLDRLSRSLLDFATLANRARRSGWSLVILDLMVDTTTPAGEALVNVLATFAQFERRMIGLRSRDALFQLRAQGRVYGRYTPLGFRREGKLLVRDREQPRIVAQTRRMYADTASFRHVAQWLNSQGLRGAGGAEWYGSAVKRMLRLNDLIGCPIDQQPLEPHPSRIYPVPFGYRFESGRFVIDPVEQAAIRRMHALRRQGFSIRQIADALTAARIPTKRNAPQWNKTTVGRILNRQGAVRAVARAQTGDAEPQLSVGRPLPRITPAPYGYCAPIHNIVPDRAEQQTIKRMRQLRAAGATYRIIARQLYAAGVRPPRAAQWRPSTIRHILVDGGPIRYRLARR